MTGGALPAGLSLDATTGAITGTPTAAGAYSVTIEATNPSGSADETFTGTVADPGPTASPPGAPTSVIATPADGGATLEFKAPANDGGAPVLGYQVSLDGGSTWNAVAFTADGSAIRVTIGALTNGEASARVTWNPSPSTSVTGYTVVASPGPAICTTSARLDTNCVIGARSGVPYTYTVIAHGPGGDSDPSEPTDAVTPQIPPVPATPPASAPATLTTTAGKITSVQPAQPVTIVGTGFAAHSSVEIVLYSRPTVLGTATAGEDGSFSAPVTVPANLSDTDHTFLAAGSNPDGTTHRLRMPVTLNPAVFRVAAPKRLRASTGDRRIGLAYDPVALAPSTHPRGYQVSLDGNHTWTTKRTTVKAGRVRLTISGLTNGRVYPARLRALTETASSSGLVRSTGIATPTFRRRPHRP